MRRSFLLLALLSANSLAHAQAVSVYATFAPVHVSGLDNGNTSTGVSTTSLWTPGFGVGATFNVLPLGPVRLGLDIRASEKPGNNGSDLILAGPRVALHLPLVKLHPYVQASGGYLRTRTALVNSPFAGSTYTNSFAAYEVLGGVDYPLIPFLDLRLIELGGGKAYVLSAAGAPANYTVSLFTVSTGVVLHF